VQTLDYGAILWLDSSKVDDTSPLMWQPVVCVGVFDIMVVVVRPLVGCMAVHFDHMILKVRDIYLDSGH
jgi:hypothetical protein